jgi:signal peptidase II
MSMKTNIPRKIFLPIIAVLMIGFVVLDQAVKKAALLSLSASPVYLNDYFGLEISRNYGIAFGFHVNIEVFYLIVILFFAWLASGEVLNFKEMKKKEILAVGFILSGALGNIIDRIRFGYIIDYINFKDIVIFNLADVFIMTGSVILLGILFCDTEKTKAAKSV